MLRLGGSCRRLCDGYSRRDFLRLGGLAPFGVTLADLFASRAAVAAPRPATGFGRAKACILLFLYGSPPQHETFDPKPDAPREVQGELKDMPTSIPGFRFCEGLTRVAAVANELTVVRSMNHRYPEHGVAYALRGIPTYDPSRETRARDSRHWPFIGSVVDYMAEKSAGDNSRPDVPRNMALPWMLNSKTDMLVNAGPFAAFLGQAYDPIWTDFNGKGIRSVPRYTDWQTKDFFDPFGGCGADGRFQFSAEGRLPADLPPDRFDGRRSLLSQFERARRELDRTATATPFDRHR